MSQLVHQIEDLETQIRAAMRANDWALAEQLGAEMDALEASKPELVLLDAALWYASAGYPVFPLKAGGKTPLTEHGFKDATTREITIRQWWVRHPRANIGIATGHAMNVVDFDRPGAIWNLAHTFPDIFSALQSAIIATVATPRGTHWWVPPSDDPNRAGIVAGVDFRGLGGYVVAPPSTTSAGNWQFITAPGERRHP